MKKFIKYILIYIISLPYLLNASEKKITNYNSYFYKGTIGKNNVILSLKMQETNAIGFYYLTNTKENKKLSGSIKNNVISIKESTSSNSYELNIKDDKSITGIGKKNETIELSLLDKINTINIERYVFSEKSITNDDTEYQREFNYDIEKSQIENKNNIKSIISINKKLKSSFDSFEKEINKELLSFTNKAIANYQYFYELETHYMDTNIIVFLEKKYVYTGGANGLSYSTPKMYSLKTGSEISYKTSSIIKNKKDATLIELMQKKLLEKNDKDMYFDFNSIVLPNVFYISSDGITFTYSLYEIAPRIAGIIEITFTFNEIKPFMSNIKGIEYLFN